MTATKTKSASPRQSKQLTVELMWQLQRLGAPRISPDVSKAVCTVAQPSVK